MGEEQKKPDDTKEEATGEVKKDEAKDAAAAACDGEKKEGGGGGGGEEKKEEAPPPPEEIVMRVFMHCEGCARKVKRILRGFDGVEDVTMDSKSHKVVVKGKKAAENPMKVVERIGKKTGRKVELVSPLPPPPLEKKEEEKRLEEEKPKEEEKKEEPVVITLVLKVLMHCEACGQQIKKRILKMKGVQTAETDVKASQVTVKGIFEAPKLVEHLYNRTGKHAIIVKQDPPEKKANDAKKDDSVDATKDDKKSDGDKEGEKKDEKDDDKDKKDGATEDPFAAVVTAKMVEQLELMRNELQYNPYRMPLAYHQYAPQMFSDENPLACSVM